MNHFLHGVARATSEAFDLPGPILEIGSYQVAGQEGIADLRQLFPDKPYLGVDVRPGPGVDCTADVEALPQADASVGTVIAMNTFEHVRRFWRGFEEIERVLCADGVLLVSCPFYFPVHNHPSDYWRFSPAALELLLADYPTTIMGWHGPPCRPLHVWAVAFREAQRAISAAQMNHYKTLVARYAREPLNWVKWSRFLLGSFLFGRGPFSPYLDQHRWEIVCRTQAPKARLRARRTAGMRLSPHS
jgi:SAM-dependent methyltransferase